MNTSLIIMLDLGEKTCDVKFTGIEYPEEQFTDFSACLRIDHSFAYGAHVYPLSIFSYLQL